MHLAVKVNTVKLCLLLPTEYTTLFGLLLQYCGVVF